MRGAGSQSRRVPDRFGDLIVSPQAYARPGQLHAAFRDLRRDQPVARVEADAFEPFWVVTRHRDILAVSHDNVLFRSADRATALVPRATDEKVRALTGSPHLIRTLVHMDPPEHTAYRAATQAWFTPRKIQTLQARIRALAGESLDRMAGLNGECEFVGDVARLFPLRVMLDILGIPDADAPHILRLTNDFFLGQEQASASDRSSPRDPARHARHLLQTYQRFRAYFVPLLEARRISPRDDVLTAVAHINIAGQPIGEFDAVSYLLILATAGHYTTSASIAGGVWGLCQQPATFAKLSADPGLVPNLVEEAVRWTTPVQHFMRTAAADTELGGSFIRKGDWLMLCYTSGSRDEAVFDDPDRFRIDRASRPAVVFGHGVHACLGQHLARLEMRIFFEEMLSRVDRIAPAGTPRRAASIFVGGPVHVPLRYHFR